MTPDRGTSGQGPAEGDALSLDGTALAPLDRVFPARTKPFITLVLAVAIGAWFVGLALAPDKAKFLASPEWRFMPFYLAAHLIAVRLFVSSYTRSFRNGVKHLDVATTHAVRGVRAVLGPVGALLAALVAAPFCYLDWRYLNGIDSRYDRLGGDKALAVDQWMWVTWCAEWFMNGLIWVMLVGFLVKNCTMIQMHAFRAPIEIAVSERHYRPFLQMSAQGASILLGFGFTTILYLWYTGGELTDYAGLGITTLLLLVGFVPPWVLLRRKVRMAVESETLALRNSLANALWRDAAARKGESPVGKVPLEQRLDEALAIFRISHLEHLKLNLGRREARAILVRLLAPAIGISWQLSQNFQNVTHNLDKTMGAMKGMIGRWLVP